METTQNRAGYWTLMEDSQKEKMHPLGNPLTEGLELYVRPCRLEERLSSAGPPLVLWDVGLGMGANVMAAIATHQALPNPRTLQILSFENRFDGFQRAASEPDKFLHLDQPLCREFAEAGFAVGRSLSWKLLEGDFFTHWDTAEAPEVIFFDPFSRNTNPRFWEEATFAGILRRCGEKATVLSTYANARWVREQMHHGGWKVAVGPGFANRNATTLAVNGAEAHRAEYRWWQPAAV